MPTPTYTITVNIADKGNPLAEGGPSSVGHVWYSLQNGDNPSTSFGFAPDEDHHGSPFAPGRVYTDDNDNYLGGRFYTRTVEISESQYNAMLDFGGNPQSYGFNLQYNGLNNSCIDFVWKALEFGGFNPTHNQGEIWPTENVNLFNNAFDRYLSEGALYPEGVDVPDTEGGGATESGGVGQDPFDDLISDLQDDFGNAEITFSPLVLDLDGDGVETISKNARINFDHDGDGFAETTGWVGADDGLLVWDKNGNGKIDNGSELFGNNTILGNGQKAANGFAALSELDSNGDGKIDSNDVLFNQLRIWKDADNSASVSSGELIDLEAAGVRSLNTGFTQQNVTDSYGNRHLQAGQYTHTDGSGGVMHDVWFSADMARTVDKNLVPVNSIIAELPEIEGFGNVHSLHQAMARDSSGVLQNLLENFMVETNYAARMAILTEMVYVWAGVGGVDPASRTPMGVDYPWDGRKLSALEVFLGDTFMQQGVSPTPAPVAASLLLGAFDKLANFVYLELMSQTKLGDVFAGINMVGGVIDVTNAVATLHVLYDASPNVEDGLALMSDLAAFLKLRGSAGQRIVDAFVQQGNSTSTGFDFYLSTLGTTNSFGDESNNQITLADDQNGKVFGLYGDDQLAGKNGNDSLYGGAGNDSLWGDAGNDKLDGGIGNDLLDGGEGDDTYVFDLGYGQDIIIDASGADVIKLGAGLTTANTKVWRDTYSLYVGIPGGSDMLTVSGWFDAVGSRVESIQFSDDSIWNTATLAAATFAGTSSDETIYATTGNDTIDGRGGNDVLYGRAGNDTYYFNLGYGQSIVFEESGTDVIKPGSGLTTANIKVWRDVSNLYVGIPDSVDILTVQGWFDNAAYRVESIEFIDGTIWNATILAAAAFGGTSVDDAIYGTIGNDTLYGFGGDDYLSGDTGNDNLDGGTGNDNLDGGAGNDAYFFGRGYGQDTIFETSGSADIIQFNADTATADIFVSRDDSNLYLSILGTQDKLTIQDWYSGTGFQTEQVKFANGTAWTNAVLTAKTTTATEGADFLWGTAGNDTINGLGSDDQLIGNEGDDALNGGAGNDYLDGGTGNDTMSGSTGDDIYIVDSTMDVVIEAANEGVDIVRSSVTYSLAADIENLTLIGPGTINGTGNALDNIIVGNALDNVIAGGAGNDALFGGDGNDTLDGGLGNDAMSGGAGNDTYIVDSLNDVVGELAGEGTDTVQSSITYTLGANLEKLTLTGSASISGTGNELNNTLTGNSGANTLIGGAGNDSLSGGTGADTMIGGTGNDTYTVDNIGDAVIENANEGVDTVKSSVTYTLGTDVENLTLTGSGAINGTGNTLDNVITGNTGNNVLNGGAGNDTLDGGAGTDTMVGGIGNDTYIVDVSTDVVTENANEGTDTVNSSITFTLSSNVENLVLTGATAINGTGNSLSNTITGNGAVNTLDGGAGADTLVGGLGDDIYLVDDANDIIVEAVGEGVDTAQSTALSYSLGANVENLTLMGAAGISGVGNGLDNSLMGNSGANTLNGGAGNDILNGGAGADTLIGGTGNDTFVIDNASDSIVEALGEGIDLVQSTVTYTLASNVENLTLTGSASINATGNELDNVLTGNSGVNTLTGGAGNDTLNGGTGADTMIGGVGDDTYTVDNAGDVVTENASEGIDTVNTALTYTLGANVENLTLTGSSAVNGTGNALDNVLIGNAGVNTLTGGAGNDTLDGKAGADTMVGGTGNDIYIVDNASDIVTENVSEGIDLVQSSVTLTLATNVEALVLTGAAAINGTGNAGDNLIQGNSAANTLNGSAGNDMLQGAAGNDTLTDTAGNNLFDGGAGTDAITGGTGNDFIVGGLGNDTITTGTGADVIAFNRGDGMDVINASTGTDNTVSLGKGIKYADLLFKKSSNDLIMVTGASEQITFKDWYLNASNQSVANLQVVIEGTTDYDANSSNQLNNKKIEKFNFNGLVGAFDQARAANAGLTSWALSSALTTFYLNGSDTAAIGGDLAYQYAKNGNLSTISSVPADTLLSSASFGTGAQTLQATQVLQDLSPRLM